ncbi:MAG: ABC transporter substrate-binding protein [Deltaproteobacteria bacterium]|nr:ABC transporter substrate-binding protein [Deltaproteobacteria bacterium]
MKRIRVSVIISMLLAAMALAAVQVSAAEPVRLVLQWEHQSQFAGYYMALEKGFYRQENLDLAILPGGAHVDPVETVRNGRAEFCTTMLAPVLSSYDRRRDNELVLLQQILNRSNLTLVAWKKGRHGSEPIASPGDLNYKWITLWERFRPPYQAFFKKFDITPIILPQYYTFSLFLRRGADACCAMRYNEYHSLKQYGLRDEELTVFDFHDLGIDLPEDGLFALKKTWLSRPQTCAAFVRATMKGWQYARDHREETLNVVMRYVDGSRLSINRPHMAWMLDVILESIFPARESDWVTGQLTEERYNRAVSILGLGSAAPAYNDFVTVGAQRGLH